MKFKYPYPDPEPKNIRDLVGYFAWYRSQKMGRNFSPKEAKEFYKKNGKYLKDFKEGRCEFSKPYTLKQLTDVVWWCINAEEDIYSLAWLYYHIEKYLQAVNQYYQSQEEIKQIMDENNFDDFQFNIDDYETSIKDKDVQDDTQIDIDDILNL